MASGRRPERRRFREVAFADRSDVSAESRRRCASRVGESRDDGEAADCDSLRRKRLEGLEGQEVWKGRKGRKDGKARRRAEGATARSRRSLQTKRRRER